MERKRVLIVDDEENFAHIVKMNLEQFGDYEVQVETRPQAALDSALRYNPDIILMDIVMPDQNGLEVLEKLKKNKRTMSIPVVMMTAVDDNDTKIKASQEFSEGYLVKPVNTEALKAKIEEVLGRRPR
ncbi:MAG: response regulator [Candidatus Omnitrophota bacterium]